ncbi:MAG: double-strand break repair helicase AddA, partial [Alphaproteobacteria bacterium]|nr:double-strand break repair helicase AddA [Alphaproteobacteria bacterium]
MGRRHMSEVNTSSRAQQTASDPNLSVWVAANAGTGKTKVLTDRVLRLLLRGAQPSRILCITYTKAAAAEMQNRIHSTLSEWIEKDDKTLTDNISALTGAGVNARMLKKARTLFARVLDAPEGVRILTIHSFCQSILRRFPLEAGIAPHFEVIDDRTRDE